MTVPGRRHAPSTVLGVVYCTVLYIGWQLLLVRWLYIHSVDSFHTFDFGTLCILSGLAGGENRREAGGVGGVGGCTCTLSALLTFFTLFRVLSKTFWFGRR